MQHIPTQKKLPPEQRQLLDLFSSLDQQNQNNLLAFAEFLVSRVASDNLEQPQAFEPVEPKLIPRPASESVVKAIKRLSASYYMLQRDKMLDETASLMTAHVMHGRDAASVIDDLERLFERHYQQYLAKD